MKKYVIYLLKGLGILAGLLFIIYTAAYIYVLANKKSIISQIKAQVAEKLNGEVQIGDIDLGFFSNFPGISVELKNISIRDTVFNVHRHPFFQAAKVNANISVINLLEKRNPVYGVRIDNGQVYIFTDTSGYTNSYLLSPKSKPGKPAASTSATQVEIEKIKLRNVRLIYNNQLKKKLYDFEVIKWNCSVKNQDSVLRFKTENNLIIHSLAFNTTAGSFAKEAKLTGDYKVYYNKKNKQLTFNDVDISLKDHDFNLSGTFVFDTSPHFKLNVNTNKIGYDFGRSLLPDVAASALGIVKLDRPIDVVKAQVSGALAGRDPLVNVQWTVRNSAIQSPFANFTDCSFNGSFNNELIIGLPRKDPNSRIQFHEFTGKWEGLGINCKNIYIDNLVEPMINCDIKTNFQLTQLNNILESATIGFNSGAGVLDITYTGPLQKNSNKNTLINGKLTFSNGVVNYLPTNIAMRNLNGNIVFKNSDVFVTDFKSNVEGNKILMNGSGKDLLSLMSTNPGRAFINWNIYSPSLNLGNFTTLLQARSTPLKVKKRKSKLGNTANNLDAVVEQANFHLNLKADQVIYKKFNATNLRAILSLVNNNWLLQKVSLQHAGGSMLVSGSLNEKNSKYYAAGLKVNMDNVDVNKVFYAFNNFGQSGIESKNLRGKLFTNADIKMDVERNLSAAPSGLFGYVDFSLRNGGLLHYEPLQKLQNVIFKNRNFDEISFAELKDRFDIKDREIIINRMEIQSSVLTLYLKGIYSMVGNTDISIQVPLSNLKKRDDNYKPTNKGVDSKGGASIYVRGRPGEDGNIKFKLDLFKKFRKGDKEDNDNIKDSTSNKSIKAKG